ncbi:hypothetical protein HPT27_18710 [Permianibacter sp. IMCC34836]|uniref:penicillin-binding protein activator n=1 Tax=Permianibacter fluminis TaxID=2738515 RepID=UPI0015549B23|nr:penicillin-binding protein activator [Permianibacter fluminis]NQD39053.1 hypothetical protein [Permianibacter fluminis]
MMPYPRQICRWLLLVSLVAMPLTGCVDDLRVQSPDDHPPLRNADYFLQAAKSATGTRAALMRLSAGELLLNEQRNDQAVEVLESLKDQPLSEDDRQRLHRARGQALLNVGRFSEAVAALELVPRPDRMDRDDYRHFLQLKVDALVGDRRPVEAAATRLVLGNQLDRSERPANEQAIWQLLKPLNYDTLFQYRSQIQSGLLAGWLDLALLYQRYSRTPDGLPQALSQWQARYPTHPAASNLPEELSRAAQANRIEVGQVALLLPLSGRLAATGRIVRDGFLAGYYGGGDADPSLRIRVYDSAGGDFVTLYRQAVADGAGAVIGPLVKEQLLQLSALGALPVPTLAMNMTDDPNQRADLLFQFGLPVEDEAEQVATRALTSFRQAMIVSNQDAVGDRAAQTMQQAFEAGGGTVLANIKLGNDKEIEASVAAMLGVDSSRQRMKALQQTLGKELGFQVRRRQDIEVILLTVKPTSARQLKPFLNLYRGEDIPILATSQLFGGQPQPQLDEELNGIEFCDVPWLLDSGDATTAERQRIAGLWPAATGSQGRLFALGYDAWRLLPELTRLSAFPDYRVSGLSGLLRIDEFGRVHRALPWARFRDGRPVATQAATEPLPVPPSAD